MDRQKHWEQVYSNKSPLEVSWFQADPAMSLGLIQSTGIEKTAAIIDVGGGASRLVDFLLSHGFTNVSVLDISSQAIEHAHTRLGEKATEVDWLVDDITAFNAAHKYDLWHDRAVFHFLTDANDRQKYVANMTAALAKGSHVIIATFAIGGPDKCSGLEIVQYDEAKIQNELGTEYKLLDVHHELHITPANKEQQFIYFHFIKQ